jgi:hemolysin III
MSPPLRVRIFKDPASSWSHFIGLWLALAATAALIWRVADDGPKAIGMAVYGASLIMLFLASSLYHWFDLGVRGNRWLRRVDHAAIFLLIAGTIVPPLVLLLDGTWRTVMLSLVLGLALAGAIFKVIWIDSPKWIGLTLYFGLSAVVLIPAHKILPQLSGGALAWLLTGGLAYALGAFVYARAWPDPWPDHFGYHDIWHLFVLAGAAAHYAFIFTLVDLPYVPF